MTGRLARRPSPQAAAGQETVLDVDHQPRAPMLVGFDRGGPRAMRKTGRHRVRAGESSRGRQGLACDPLAVEHGASLSKTRGTSRAAGERKAALRRRRALNSSHPSQRCADHSRVEECRRVRRGSRGNALVRVVRAASCPDDAHRLLGPLTAATPLHDVAVFLPLLASIRVSMPTCRRCATVRLCDLCVAQTWYRGSAIFCTTGRDRRGEAAGGADQAN